MKSLGIGIGKILAPFRKHLLEGASHWLYLTQKELDGCCWASEAYPATLKKLMKHKHFAGDEKMADAYICGYYRGMRDAVVELTKE